MDISMIMFKLVDVLQCPITIRGGEVSGHSTANVTLAPGMSMPLKITVVKAFMNRQAGVLVHVKGDLFILVAYNPMGQSTSAYLINGKPWKSKEGAYEVDELFSSSDDLRHVVEKIRESIVSSFFRISGGWSPLTLPT